jgi:dynein heavy chain
MSPVKMQEVFINKVTAVFLKDSFDDCGSPMLKESSFLKDLKAFAENERDQINDETCELLEPYLNPEVSPFSHKVLDQSLARKANVAAEGLCKFVGAMVMYHEASKIVKPKMMFLQVQEAKLDKANQELESKEAELEKVNAEVAASDRQLQ